MVAYLADLDSLLDPFIRFLTQGYVPWSLTGGVGKLDDSGMPSIMSIKVKTRSTKTRKVN